MAIRKKPTKKQLKIANELIVAINRLTCRWHLGFHTDEREVIRDALYAYQQTTRGKL